MHNHIYRRNQAPGSQKLSTFCVLSNDAPLRITNKLTHFSKNRLFKNSLSGCNDGQWPVQNHKAIPVFCDKFSLFPNPYAFS